MKTCGDKRELESKYNAGEYTLPASITKGGVNKKMKETSYRFLLLFVL